MPLPRHCTHACRCRGTAPKHAAAAARHPSVPPPRHGAHLSPMAAAPRGARMPDIADIGREYLPILMFFGVALAFALVFVALPILLANVTGTAKPYGDKLTEYESGFPAFSSARGQFDVRFYLVSILFIIFDLEVAFLFPWAVSLQHMGPNLVFGWVSMMIFLAVLTVGFVYEWKKGALDWE
jgi:NADH-quinone oxidoreductase subunit A